MVDCKLVAGLSNATKAAHTIIQVSIFTSHDTLYYIRETPSV